MERKENGVIVVYPDKRVVSPVITDVRALPDFMLFLKFSGGECRIFDVKPLFTHPKAGDTFSKLKTKRGLFEKVKLGTAGWGVVWDDTIDIGSEHLYCESASLSKVFNKTHHPAGSIKPRTATRSKKTLAHA
jgi:hypothetical protein